MNRFREGERVLYVGGPSWDITVAHELELEAEDWYEVTIMRPGTGGWDWVVDTGRHRRGNGPGMAPTEMNADECQLRPLPINWGRPQ